MDLTPDYHKRIYERVDKMIGTDDSQLNGAVKAALLKDEMPAETIQQVELKLAYNNWLLEQVAKNEMRLTFDIGGNVIEIPSEYIDDVSGSDFTNVVYEPKASEESA